jgi:acyl carrier protein
MARVDRDAFYLKIDDLLELPGGSVKGSTALEDVEEWDSLAVISFIAMVDTDFGISLPAKSITACRKIDDLADLIDADRQE